MFLSFAAAVTDASAAAHRQALESQYLSESLKHPAPSPRLFLLSRCALLIGELLRISMYLEKRSES